MQMVKAWYYFDKSISIETVHPEVYLRRGPFKHLKWFFLAKIVNSLKSLTMFVRTLVHRWDPKYAFTAPSMYNKEPSLPRIREVFLFRKL